MNSKRLYFGLITAILLLLIALLVGAYTVNKQMTARATKLTDLKAKSAALAQEQIILKKAKSDIETYAELKKITQAIVPEDKSQAEAVREIVKIAGENGIKIAAISFPASTLGSSPIAGATSSTPTPASSSGNSKKSALSQLVPVKNIPGVYQLLITIESDPDQPVRYDKFISFLSALENNRRTAQVNTITLEPDKTNPGFLSFSLTLNGYVKP